jgi:FkbM family methyltransferase
MHYRTFGRLLRASANIDYYRALARSIRSFDRPWRLILQYLGLRDARFPLRITANIEARAASFTLYCADDVVTAVECFGKLDYRADPAARCIVDFGSNIGLSALYFLIACPGARVYAFEPDPRNVERLRDNLAPFAERYVLDVAAVGPRAGRMQFGREPTGRYGGLGLDFPDHIDVDVRDANAALASILEREGRIDLLKIDIEGQERPVLEALSPAVLSGIDALVVEIAGTPPVLPGFAAIRHSGIVRYERDAAGQSKSNTD